MGLTGPDRQFLDANHSAAMVTLRPDGRPHAVRVGVALVDGRLLASGVRSRARNAHLRRDPRCTLFVFDKGFGYLSLETDATILDGPEVPELSLRLFRVMQHRPTGDLLWNGVERTPEEFLAAMVEEQRLLYEFEVARSYGLQAPAQ
jgi:PPOX class probable F420-dependent enzyme